MHDTCQLRTRPISAASVTSLAERAGRASTIAVPIPYRCTNFGQKSPYQPGSARPWVDAPERTPGFAPNDVYVNVNLK
ncbi:MAG: hypothetical protein RLY71_2477 [Pseudomonadota bacterium]|jgi:hypothetical protein